MAISLIGAKKKQPFSHCIGASNVAKFAAGEFSCAAALQASYKYKSPKEFNNYDWYPAHARAIELAVEYLNDHFSDLKFFENETLKLKQKIGDAVLFGVPDVVAVKEGKLYLFDGKAGQKREFHKYQISLYGLLAISKNIAQEIGGLYLGYFDPEIDNDNFEVVEVGATKEAKEIWSTDIKKRLVMLSKTLVSKQTAPTSPSDSNCRFCPWRERCSTAIDPEEELVDIFANLGV